MPRIQHITSLPNDKGIDVCELVKEHHFGLYETIGARPSQEDAAFACWYAREHFKYLTPQEIGRRLWTSYHLVNILGRNMMYGGTTASTTVYDGHGALITATLADSLSFAAIFDKQGEITGVVRLNNIIHHPNVELERIQRAGGTVFFDRINGQLAVSRAIGDFDYNAEVVCADASIDVNYLDEIYEHIGISKENVGKVQLITTCDGFTEPLAFQTKKEHEQWLLNCLKEIPSASALEEQLLAKMLANKALEWGSRDNISIAVQTLSLNVPFLVGIYDGHGGKGASRYTAENIGAIFDYQCSLTQEAYAQQSLSADKNFTIYYRDNKDREWYEPLADAAKKERESELSKSGGVRAQMQLLMKQAEAYKEKEADKKGGEVLAAAVQNFYEVMDVLCHHYTDLTLSKEELGECVSYILSYDTPYQFTPARYSFLSLNFKKCKEDAELIKKNDLFLQIIRNLTRVV
ncbi:MULTISPECIES: PP2C family serine/threonine-protein phosphatase [Legionella]|uniref:Protein phosphatase 2C domain-containing protein n=1 Tax=Legionella resiliens TaxID=2905958 RepID=A0ABS8X1F0_9GAMM|nr:MULTISPECIES: PP2C family protein-serine/threonine phosphatase [unclassified Legionella]MCE0722485.1 protein phosphatase 2C domain-containing protein [Legionella sp. 9fVS26]MCE3531639.1 protein phosphatase 2C domain-containing protein [Legionella sp. 8cVS16]QLZ67659.1 protein serine/threonine phosphatase 2C family protein [Legionella sp. PC1000]